MLEHPCVLVKQEDGMETRRQRRIDIAFGAVADHPATVRRELVAVDDRTIRRRILFRNNLDRRKMRCEPGVSQLVGLLGVIALGHQDQLVPSGEIRERFIYLRQQLDLLVRNGLRKSDDAPALFFCHLLGAESFKTLEKRPRKAAEAVAVGQDGFALDGVERIADFGWRVMPVIEKTDKRGD